MWLQEEATLKKTSWRGVGGEGAAPPPQKHWMSLHRLAMFLHLFNQTPSKTNMNTKNKDTRTLRHRVTPLPMHPGSSCSDTPSKNNVFCCCCCCCWLERVWLQEEATFKKTSWRGVGGDGVVVVVLVGWKGCGCKRRQPLKNKLEGGWGGGRSASPPDALDVPSATACNHVQRFRTMPSLSGPQFMLGWFCRLCVFLSLFCFVLFCFVCLLLLFLLPLLLPDR